MEEFIEFCATNSEPLSAVLRLEEETVVRHFFLSRPRPLWYRLLKVYRSRPLGQLRITTTGDDVAKPKKGAAKPTSALDITLGERGWVRVRWLKFPNADIYVRFSLYSYEGAPLSVDTEAGEKAYFGFRAREIFLGQSEAGFLNVEIARHLPLARIEAAVNNYDGPSLGEFLGKIPSDNYQFHPSQFFPVKFAALGQLSKEDWDEIEASMPAPLKRPKGRNLPDDFYQLVAEHYTFAVLEGDDPLPAIASAAKVPASTAARWVRVAREKGFLAKTSKGRVS